MIDPVVDGTLNVITTKAIKKTTESFIDSISFKFAKDKYEVIKFALSRGLPNYLAANYAKCETLKTLLNRNDPIPLADCFVAPDFEFKGKTISSINFLDHMNEIGGKAVITGLAGSGKSIFLKFSFRRVIEHGHSYYPIFFELRSLNSLPAKNGFLMSEIFRSIKLCCNDFTKAQFNHGLKSGALYFLLDGFDELKQELRERVSTEINDLACNHHKCVILVTSRPSDEFVSWEGFSEAKLLPFSLDKAVEYISKLKFDEDKKRDFLEDLRGSLFEKNKEFLSNPLLCAMMLLTYDSFGEIPEKRHIFYAKCFDVLVREHDASKGRYKRELYSNLATDLIEKVFMFFCAFTYVDRQFSFSDNEIKKYVEQAISSVGADADSSEVIMDFRESISIIELVGLNFEFAHRSFQEYFYAKFVVSDRELSLEQKIGWLVDQFIVDDTVEMIVDMDRIYFEDEFLLPNIKKIDIKLSKVDPQTNPAGVLSKFYQQIDITNYAKDNDEYRAPHVAFTISNLRNCFIWLQARQKYHNEISSEFGDTHLRTKDKAKIDASILREEFDGELKIHHANNSKLKRINASNVAEQIKNSMSLLRQHLETKQKNRKSGLGVLIRRKYLKK